MRHSKLPLRLSGFTLVEVLLASLILALSTVAITQLCRRCISNHLLIGEYQCAYQLADELLDRALARELALPTQQAVLTGDFAPENPEYAWSLTIHPTPRKSLYNLAVTISWTARENQYSVAANSLMYDFLERPGAAPPSEPPPPPAPAPVTAPPLPAPTVQPPPPTIPSQNP
jgi:Tfp pilus assembly protein PilV